MHKHIYIYTQNIYIYIYIYQLLISYIKACSSLTWPTHQENSLKVLAKCIFDVSCRCLKQLVSSASWASLKVICPHTAKTRMHLEAKQVEALARVANVETRMAGNNCLYCATSADSFSSSS